MNLLQSINDFGSIDAESDGKLIEYFIQSPALEKLINYEKGLVLGRKGSGKTAIYKFLVHVKPQITSPLLFRDYPWKIHDRFVSHFASSQESYINSWNFLFFIEALKVVIKNIDSFQDTKIKREINKCKKWLIRNWGSEQFSHKESLLPKRRKFSFSFSPSILGNSLGSVSNDFFDEQKAGQTITEINRKLESILAIILESFGKPIYLLFDELDLAYSSDDPNYFNRVIGLLSACYKMFNKSSKKIRIILFLRTDIFEQLKFQDRSKIEDNMIINLNWDPNDPLANFSLKQLISKRIQVNINSKSDNFERNWSEVVELGNMGRNQQKWNFIIERTFDRPRDVIKFMNLSLERAKARLLSNVQSIDKITTDDIHGIRRDYSIYLFRELEDEVLAKYPAFSKYMNILRDIHDNTFSRSAFIKSFEKIKTSYGLEETETMVLERLFEFGIIGFLKSGGGGGGSEYCYCYDIAKQSFNPKAETFKTHYGFKEYLEMAGY
ncbi:MAG: hypothetical protein GYA51_18930 [Candidatus Methanofastidiosa archaeon]|nr:hypothetical protein [Candidatus Methanofastidiosa archaeon]